MLFKPNLQLRKLYSVYLQIHSQCLYSTEPVMNVFDRKLKRLHRNRAALNKDHLIYDYIRDEV